MAKTFIGNIKGPAGDPGADGAAATVAIGTVTTGETGTEASVTNRGTTTNAILDFVIPRGDKGDPGSGGDVTTYTVTFDSDGGTAVAAQTVVSGSTATEPTAPTKTGYNFKYWALNDAEYNFSTPVTENITLTAIWELASYTVTFNSNGGTAVAAQTITYNNTATEPTAPTKDGCSFKYWALNGVEYNFSTPVTNDITLIAVWEGLNYTVTFDSNGGTTVAAQTVASGSVATEPTAPTKAGYNFKYWALNGVEYDFSTPVTNDITLIAVWEEITYTVTFNSNGGTAVAAQTITYNNTATEPTTPTKDGYNFKYWALNGVEYNFSTPVTSDITLVAVWEEITYTVTFNSDGGTAVAAQTVASGSVATEPTAPTKDGCSFEYWALNGVEYNFSTPVTSDITLVAVWKETYEQLINYTMLYDYGDECTNITGGWGLYTYDDRNTGKANAVKNSDHIYLQSYRAFATTLNSIDLTDYTIMFMNCYTLGRSTSYGAQTVAISPTGTVHSSYAWYTDGTDILSVNVNKTSANDYRVSIPIASSYRKPLYIGVRADDSGDKGYINLYHFAILKEDDWQTLASKAGITATSINDILTNSTTLLSNEEAVEFMIYNCTGDFMVSAIQSSTFLTALNNSAYKTKIHANEHWNKFLTMVA